MTAPNVDEPAATRPYKSLTETDVRRILGQPDEPTRTKVRGPLGLTARRFIAHSPFVCLATSDSEGGADCSPRGDGPGFVKVLDQWTLALPDRIGNALGDSFRNLFRDDAIGMLFLVPGLRETLRVNGRGYLTDDETLCDRFTADGRRPKMALVVEVEQNYFHCGKALIRSRLWDPTTHSLAAAATMGITVFSLQYAEYGREGPTTRELGDALEHSYVVDL
jgi:PPOX class probable FMN-dependent enzyme